MDEIQERFKACLEDNSSKNFEKLYALSSSRLYAVLLRILRQETLAQDCLQEVYMKIWQRMQQYDADRGNCMAWMSVIARNHALDSLKRKNIVSYTDDLSYIASDDESVTHDLIEAEEGSLIRNCLKQLKPEQEHCILMSYYKGDTYQQIADNMGKPVSTIKTWVSRSMPILKKCLEKANG